jgi:hypothetical protein
VQDALVWIKDGEENGRDRGGDKLRDHNGDVV